MYVNVTTGTAPKIIKFTAAPMTITAGQSSTLLWLVDNATKITIDNGIGDVDAANTRDVTPAATTTYTITASNSFGSVQAQLTITVNPPPVVVPDAKITSFTANPTTAQAQAARWS